MKRNRQLCGTHGAAIVLALAGCFGAPTWAHGPEGDHDHGAADSAAIESYGAHAAPRMEARTEAFELVATLEAGELSVMVDRYATNEPVLGGQVDVEVNGIRAQGTFHADQGDYAFTDPALLKALAQPGHHALVFTVVSGDDSDLLEGALHVEPDAIQAQPTSHALLGLARWQGIALVAVLILIVAAVAWRIASRRSARPSSTEPSQTGEA
ncbi:hypothetical protein [Aquabacterium sp.]|uniref:hypothetical protein n=1 Tax=Aquabacterium sp. TaxID=1872578 RepID=UPI002E35F23D|nr:hypothetical protein [Aquabacterium sp.]HEX5312385.1 hypothetical protein [Aquabacterium sp.]